MVIYSKLMFHVKHNYAEIKLMFHVKHNYASHESSKLSFIMVVTLESF